MLTALSHADHWSRTNLRAGIIGMELSQTLTAVVMSEVDSPQLTENAVYGAMLFLTLARALWPGIYAA